MATISISQIGVVRIDLLVIYIGTCRQRRTLYLHAVLVKTLSMLCISKIAKKSRICIKDETHLPSQHDGSSRFFILYC